MALQGAPLLLLLLLAAALVVLGVRDRDKKDSPYERFLRQHVRPKSGSGDRRYCNDEMRRMLDLEWKMDHTRPRICKERSTFIHGNKKAIRAVCTAQRGREFGRDKRQSLDPFQVTNCKHHGGTPPKNCQYEASTSSRTIVIACDEAGFPVHLDETQI